MSTQNPAYPTVEAFDLRTFVSKVATTKQAGEILVAANGDGLRLFLDAPWASKAHAGIKDAIKEKGARWDPANKCWRLGVTTLLLHLDVFDDQRVVVTPEAKKMLDAAIGCQKSSDAADAGESVKQRIRAVLPEGLDLYPFQFAGVGFVDRAGGRALIADEMGCVDGDAVVTAYRAGRGFKIKLKNLFHKFHGGESRNGRCWDPAIQTYIRSAHGDELRPTRIKNVLNKGIKLTLEIRTKSGKILRVTPDHKICVGARKGRNRYKRADSLHVGDVVLVNGKSVCPKCGSGSSEDIITYHNTKFRSYCRTCMYRQLRHNRPGSLQVMAQHQHAALHPIYRNFGFTVAVKDTVVSIKDAGDVRVYDVMCEGPHHNFVANGIVVHNCGKSIEALGYLALHPELRPAVLVVPAVVTSNWRREVNKWLPKDVVQVFKTGKDKINSGASILVITYDLLKKHIEAIKKINPKVVVGDEVHLCKNYKAQRTQAFCGLAKHPSVKALVGLSGTPIVNRPIEFYTFLNLLRPSDFGSWMRFTEQYCGGHYEQVARGKTVWVAKGATNTQELNLRLRSFMIRRTKDQVLTELPAKTRTIADVEMTSAERRAYRDIRGENALAIITAQRQFVGTVKVRAAMDWIEQYAETDTPLLVFAHHKEVLNALQVGCQKLGVRFGRIDGSVEQEQRGRLVDDFQAGKLDIMLLSTKAAGVGITLTRASNVLEVEKPWAPGDREQALDRCHRIGQTNAVTCQFLTVNATVDSDMEELLESKRLVLEAVLDGKMDPQDLDIRAELVARMEARK